MARTKRLTVPALITLTLLLVTAPLPSQTPPGVGTITGEMVARAEDGRHVGKLEATVSWSAGEGTAHLRFAPFDASTTVQASAQIVARRREEAFGAVSALILAIVGRPSSNRTGLQLVNVEVKGDVRAIRPHADTLVAWWDAQAGMSVAGYVSPVLTSAQVGRLHLNVWGTNMRGHAVLLFNPGDPTEITGGRFVCRVSGAADTVVDLPNPFEVTFARLIPIPTPAPNDFVLMMGRFFPADFVNAEVLIDVLADGTIDVRGSADHWCRQSGVFTVEGTGSTNFVTPPGS